MRSLIVFVLGLTLVLASEVLGGNDPTTPLPGGSYVKVWVEVEIRGVLHQNDKGITVASRLRVYELFNPAKELPQSSRERPADVYGLDFSRAKAMQQRAEGLLGEEVVVAGVCEMRMVDQPRRPGGSGGSGFGSPGWIPGPTWSLQQTVLVKDIKKAPEK